MERGAKRAAELVFARAEDGRDGAIDVVARADPAHEEDAQLGLLEPLVVEQLGEPASPPDAELELLAGLLGGAWQPGRLDPGAHLQRREHVLRDQPVDGRSHEPRGVVSACDLQAFGARLHPREEREGALRDEARALGAARLGREIPHRDAIDQRPLGRAGHR
ncbi:MAG: hypothetical protein IPF92_10020 [Myxococcales bacterium]|nr:hypothetical protein [Myxococcales bacterium]